MRIALNSQTNVKIDINYVIDNQNMPEHNNDKELGIFVTYLSIREYPNLMHTCSSPVQDIPVVNA